MGNIVRQATAEFSAGPDSVNERLRALRGRRSRRSFANLLGVHFNTLLNYEKGRTPDYEFLLHVCARTQCDRNWLFFGSPADPPIPLLPISAQKVHAKNATGLDDDVPLVLEIYDTARERLGEKGKSISRSQLVEIVRMAVSSLRACGETGPGLPNPGIIEASVVLAERMLLRSAA
jgi:transcriptional regulator with XRE-family HTH domain